MFKFCNLLADRPARPPLRLPPAIVVNPPLPGLLLSSNLLIRAPLARQTSGPPPSIIMRLATLLVLAAPLCVAQDTAPFAPTFALSHTFASLRSSDPSRIWAPYGVLSSSSSDASLLHVDGPDAPDGSEKAGSTASAAGPDDWYLVRLEVGAADDRRELVASAKAVRPVFVIFRPSSTFSVSPLSRPSPDSHATLPLRPLPLFHGRTHRHLALPPAQRPIDLLPRVQEPSIPTRLALTARPDLSPLPSAGAHAGPAGSSQRKRRDGDARPRKELDSEELGLGPGRRHGHFYSVVAGGAQKGRTSRWCRRSVVEVDRPDM